MVKFIENMAVQAVADYQVAGTPLNWTITRERDIESLEVVFCMGNITQGGAAVPSYGEPSWGLTFFQAVWDDKVIRLPGRMMGAYNSFFYPNDPAKIGAAAWTALVVAAIAPPTWYARYRIACHVPQKAGAYITCSATTSGEATYCTSITATTAFAASNIFVMPRYGTFDYQLSCNYQQTLAVAGDTTFLPGTTGNLWVGSIIGAYNSLAAFVNGLVLSGDSAYGANTYTVDNVISLLIDVAGDTVVQLPNAVQAEWPWQNAYEVRLQNRTVAIATPVDQSSIMPLCELLVEGGLEMPSGSTVRYMINANTSDVQVLTIYGDVPQRQETGGTPVSNTKTGPGGTSAGPAAPTGRIIRPTSMTPGPFGRTGR